MAAAGLAHQPRIAPDFAGKDGKQQDHAFGDGRVIGRYIEDEEDVDDDHQHIGADDRAGRAAAPATKRGAADDDGGEHLQQHRIADQRIARALSAR